VSRGRRRAAALAVLLLAAGLGAWEALDGPPGPGEPAPAEDADARRVRVERALAEVRARYHAVERRALETADAAVPAVLAAVPRPGDSVEDRTALFEALARSLGPERGDVAGAAVVDREGHPLAWWGRAFIGSRQGPPLPERNTRVVRTRVYRVALAEVPLTGPGGDVVGAVRVYAPFQASLPLDNRYLRRIDFEEEAVRDLGLQSVDLEFGPAAEGEAPPAPADEGGLEPLAGVLGHTLGTLEVAVRPLEEVRAAERTARSRGRRAGLAALAVLVALGAPLRRLGSRPGRGAARAALLLGARAALLALGMPGDLLPGDPFDLSAFSVTWLGGALRTPGDALLSAAALLGAVAALARAVPPPVPVRTLAARARALVGGVAAALAAWAAVTALAEAAAFQSRVDLFPEDRVLAPAAAAALQLAVGCTAAAGLVAALRLLAVAAGRRLWPSSAAARGIALAAAAAVISQFTLQWHALQALRQDALASGERPEAEREREQRAVLSNLLERLAAPGGTAEKALRGRGPRPADAAFFLWAGSPDLNGRPDGCSLEILDASGGILSRFEIDVPPRSWLPEPRAVPEFEPAVERSEGRKGAAGRPFLVAAAPVRAASGAVAGGLRLCVPAGPPSGEAAARPEILRNYGGARPPPRGRAIHRAVFDGARLRESTNPDYPRGMPAPAEAVEKVLGRGDPVLWVREEVAGGLYHNAYMPRTEEGRVVGLSSVGFPSLEARQIWLNTAKVLFLHLLAGAAAGLAAAAVAAARGRLRLPAFGFRAKLLAGFVLVGAVPVVGLTLLETSLAGERARETMEREVVESLRVVEASLRDAGVLADLAAPEPEARISDDRVKEIAYRAGVPVNLFLGDRLLASSERGIFATELFSPRLAPEATRQVLLLGRGAFAARERFGSFPFLVGYAPVRGEGASPAGVLSVPLLFRQDRADRDLARATTAAVALYLVVLLLVAGAGAVLARRVARPVEALVEGTGRVAAGDLSTRIPRGPKDELGDLVDSFNRMTAGLEAGREAEARAQREAAWREMAKQVAHEIKNPLTPMRLHAQHLLRAQEDGSGDLPDITRKAAEVVLRQAEALERIAGDFSAFARLPRRSPGPLDLAVLAREAADLYRGSETVKVDLEAPEGLPPVLGDREEMRLVLVNLCGNALEAMPDGGRLAIRVRADAGPPPAVVLEVEDTGVGIRAEDLPRLFDPSFSTKTRGTGLGLAIVRRAVEDAGGSVSVESTPGKGSRFTVRLPAAPPA